MNLIAYLVIFTFVVSLFEILGGFLAFYASVPGRILAVIVAIIMLRVSLIFDKGVLKENTSKVRRQSLRYGCFLMIGANYLWGAKYLLDSYPFADVVTICLITHLLLTVALILSNQWHQELVEQELVVQKRKNR